MIGIKGLLTIVFATLITSSAYAATKSLGSGYQCRNGGLIKNGRSVSAIDSSAKVARLISNLAKKLADAQKAKASSAKISSLRTQLKAAKELKSGIDKCSKGAGGVNAIWNFYIRGFSTGTYTFNGRAQGSNQTISLQTTDYQKNKSIRLQFFFNDGLEGYCRGEFAARTEIANVSMPRVFGTTSDTNGDSEFTIGADGLFLASKIRNPELPEVVCNFTGQLRGGVLSGTFVITTGSLNQDASGSFTLTR